MTIAARLHLHHHAPKPNPRETRAQLRQLTEAIRDGKPLTPHAAAALERELGGDEADEEQPEAEERGPGGGR